MRRLRILTHPIALAIFIVYAGAAFYGWQDTLGRRKAYYTRLASYYAEQGAKAGSSPRRVARCQILTLKYQDAARRPWTLAPPRNPEY